MAPQQTLLDASETVARANASVVAALARRDGSAFAQCYTEDGQLLPPGFETVGGRAAIAGFRDIWNSSVPPAP